MDYASVNKTFAPKRYRDMEYAVKLMVSINIS